MNNPEGDSKFVPKQALAPTPELYDELVGDGMENLAKESFTCIAALPDNAVLNDNGCGTGAGTAGAMAQNPPATISIKGTDINDAALELYRKRALEGGWPAEAVHMDSNALSYSEATFSHIIGNALLFVLPNDGIDAIKEMHRTLRPGGTCIVNSWAYVPNMKPLEIAAEATRPKGTPLPRSGMGKWNDGEFIRGVVEKGGFEPSKIQLLQKDVYVTTSEMHRYATMLWSFIGGTTAVGWIKSDEDDWDKAIEIIKQELLKTDGYRELEGGRGQLRFIAHVLIANK